MLGTCHQACTVSPDLADVVGDIQEGLEARDARRVASTILQERAGLVVEYIPAAGRIDFVLSCDLNRTARTIAVAPDVRKALAAGMAAAAR